MAATINTLIWSSSPGTSGISFTGSNLSGDGGKFIRVKTDMSGFELYTLPSSVASISGTSPISASGTTSVTISIPGLSGLGSANQLVRSTGSGWQYVTPNGSGAPVATSGASLSGARLMGLTSAANITADYGSFSGLAVRGEGAISFGADTQISLYTGSLFFNVGSATAIRIYPNTGEVVMDGILSGPSFKSEQNNIGFFGKTPTTRKTVNVGSINTSVSNPVLNTTSFMSQINALITSYRSLVQALGDVSGYGLIDSDI